LGGDLQKLGRELIAAADVDRLDRVGNPELLEQDDDLLAVSGGPEIELDHAFSPVQGGDDVTLRGPARFCRHIL
jgi:hypothetical protein